MEVEVDKVSDRSSSRDPRWPETYDSEVLDIQEFLKARDQPVLEEDNRNYWENTSPKGSEPDLGNGNDNSQDVQGYPSFSDVPDLDDALEPQEVKDEGPEPIEVEEVVTVKQEEEEVEENHDEEELPEGWVKSGKGLKAEFLNTPRGSAESNLESKNLFMNFTNGRSPVRSNRSLQNALMSLDRSAVRELKASTPSARLPRQGSTKFELNNLDHYPAAPQNQSNTRRRSASATKATSAKLVDTGYQPKVSSHQAPNTKLSRPCHRNNYYTSPLTWELESLRLQHKNELDQTKQALLAQAEDLVKKYRELAVDAVNAARNEQRRCQEECKQAYSTAYNACVKYEKELKNTVRVALKEYQHNAKDTRHLLPKQRDEFFKRCQDLQRHSRADKLAAHSSLREDLSYSYRVDEQLLVNFEPKVLAKFNSLVTQLALYLEGNFNFSHQDSTQFVKSVISNHFP